MASVAGDWSRHLRPTHLARKSEPRGDVTKPAWRRRRIIVTYQLQTGWRVEA